MKGLTIVFLFLSTTAFAQTLQQATLDDLHLAVAEEYDTPKKMAKCYRSKNCTPVMVETLVLRQPDRTLVLVKRIPTTRPSPDMNINHSADQFPVLSSPVSFYRKDVSTYVIVDRKSREFDFSVATPGSK